MGKNPQFLVRVWFGFFDDKGLVLFGYEVLLKVWVKLCKTLGLSTVRFSFFISASVMD